MESQQADLARLASQKQAQEEEWSLLRQDLGEMRGLDREVSTMSAPAETGAPEPGEGNDVIELRLYIAGEALNSVRAIANLRAICQERFPNRHRIQIVDMLQEPLRALSARDPGHTHPGQVVTAAGAENCPGDLSDRAAVLLALTPSGLGPYGAEMRHE